MTGYPFDSHVEYDEHDIPIFDRAISSVPLKNLIAKLFSNGVLPNPATNLQVVSGGDGMTVIVKAGFCIINGGLKLEDEDKTLVVQASDPTYPRIDTVVMRWNDNDEVRACDLYVVEGTPSANPVRPALTRAESIYELGLADIFITAGSTTIDSFRITDTRYDMARCGVISSISEFDTSEIYAQIQADMAEFKTDEQADFLAWFEEMRDQLSEDAAGNLQNEIDEVNGRFNGLTEDVQRWEVRNTLPDVGREGTVYLLTGEQETHYNGDVDDDNPSVINDDMISTGTTFSSNKITNLLNSKVNAEFGKGLSSNDLTNTLVEKINNAISQVKTINGQSIVGTGNIEVAGKSIASMSVNASNHLIVTYTDGTTQDVGEIQISGGGGLSSAAIDALLALAQVLAYSVANGQTYFNALEEALRPSKTVVSISAVKTKTTYSQNEAFDISDMTVTALFSDNSTEDVTRDCSINSGAINTANVGVQTLPISYAYGGNTVTTSVNITVESKPVTVELVSIGAIKTKTVYKVGDTLNVDDVQVLARYSDDSSHYVMGYTLDTSQVSMLAEGDYEIYVTYSENEITKHATIDITVEEAGVEPRGQLPLTFTQNKQLSRFKGTIENKDNYACTEAYTNLVDGMEYTIASSTSTGYTVDTVFYNSSKTYIGYVQTRNGKLNVPSGSAYVRIGCYPNANASHITLTESRGE